MLLLPQMIHCFRKIPLLRRLLGPWAGDQRQEQNGRCSPEWVPASACSRDRLRDGAGAMTVTCRQLGRLPHRRGQASRGISGSAELQNSEVVKFICKIQKKLILIEKACEMNTTSLFIHLNNITPISYVDIYSASLHTEL